MKIKITPSVIVHAVTLVLLVAFGVKVTQCVILFMEGKVARSTEGMFEQYVKFPTVRICIGISSPKAIIGFEDTGARPMNTTLEEFEFVRHLENGYAKNSFILLLWHRLFIIQLDT